MSCLLVVVIVDRFSGNEAASSESASVKRPSDVLRYHWMLKQRKRRRVIGDPLTATTLREIHAQSRPENAVFLPWPRPQDQCSYRHSLRSRAIDLTDGHDLQNARISPQREILMPHLRSREMVGPLAAPLSFCGARWHQRAFQRHIFLKMF